MDFKFFGSEVASCKILTSDEALSVFMAKAQDSTCAFSSVPRFVADSNILEFDEFYNLQKVASEKCSVDLTNCKLLFRGSDHGFAAAKFHELCDGKGPTLTVVLTEFGHVIGGFTKVHWMSANCWKQDTDAWLFVSRVNESKKAQYSGITMPAILPVKAEGTDAAYHKATYGPTFGGGHDLYIATNCNVNADSYCDPHSYSSVCDGVTLNKLAITGGSGNRNFRVINYEVFRVL